MIEFDIAFPFSVAATATTSINHAKLRSASATTELHYQVTSMSQSLSF